MLKETNRFVNFISSFEDLYRLIMIGQEASSSRYLIKPLTHQHQEAAIRLARQTFLQEPLRVGFFKKFPEKREEEDQYWRVAMKIFQQQFFNYGWSIGCFDLENNGELVGILLAADSSHQVPEEIAQQMTTTIAGKIMLASMQLIEGIDPKYQEVFNPEKTRLIDLEIIGIKNGHRGKHLVTKMMAAYEEVAIAKGFEHSFSWASNARTGAVFQKMDYEVASELNIHNAKDEMDVLCFAEVEEEHKLNRIWLKKLVKVNKRKKNEGV